MIKKLIVLFLAFISVGFASAQQLAFPGAEGFGKYATGGRTGTVYHVRNLNDSGSGSLRDALSQPNRIVVFDVAGVIKISSGMTVAANIYIAGQTAPGEGVTVYGDRISFSGANNSICRYMRFRMGVIGSSGKDAMGIANGSNMIFDHVSVSWGRDETFSINWDGKGTEPANITIQNSIIAQGLLLHSAGGLIQTSGGVTLYRNLYVDNSTRNNKVKGVSQFVNNVVYNWKNAAYIMGGDSEGSSYVNVNANYFVKGPANGGTPISDGNADFHIYANDNWYDNNLDGALNGYEVPYSEYSGGPDFQTTPFDYPLLPAWPASSLLDSLLPKVGASLPYSDLADYYVINEVKSFGLAGEIISNESTLPIGAPNTWTLWAGNTRTDTDNDGMPDAWEEANGTNKAVNDAMTIAANGYANIENYINSINESTSQTYLRTPLNFRVHSASTNTITFTWLDYVRDEEGFIIERNVNSTFEEVGRVGKNENTFTLSGLAPEEKGTFRVCAYNQNLKSAYAIIDAKSRPVEVEVLNLDTFIPDFSWEGKTDNKWDKSTQNWTDGANTATFTDNSSVLFANVPAGDQMVDLSETVLVKAVVVNTDYNYTISGNGSISGEGSMNKTGKGTLKLGSNNTYTGATVIWDGTLEIDKLANGGSQSSIGSSANYGFNLVLKGGKLNYTGPGVSTDRNITLGERGELSVANASTTLTMNGVIAGSGAFVKSGDGILKFTNKIGNVYEGVTNIAGGSLQIDMNTASELIEVIGTSNTIELSGGALQTINGQSSGYETYSFNLIIPEGKTGGFYPYRNCYIKSKISGSGTLNFTIPYVREYIQGDWSEFSGIVNANGIGSDSNGSQFMLNNSVGLPNTRVNLMGNAKIINWATTGTMRIGGLSGSSATKLGCASKSTDGTLMTWIVGGAGTDETFNGIINNDCSANGHYGVTSIVKEGTGVWRLNGSNSYTGTTRISDGKLVINGIHSGKGAITVESGSILAGKGRVGSSVRVNEDGQLEPGDQGIGTLIVGSLVLDEGSRVNMEIDQSNSTYDKISSGASISYKGILHLAISGSLTAGDQFILFTGTAHTGEFTEIVPATPGEGLIWAFNNGVLKVQSANVAEIINDNEFTIYPNPAHDQLTVNLSKEYHHAIITIQTVNGQIVFSDMINGQCDTLNLTTIGRGNYILQIVADGEILNTKKIVIDK